MAHENFELTLIYDGECGFCLGWVEWARRYDPQRRVEFLPCQSQERQKRFPKITEADCLRAMYVVLPKGQTFSGADAATHILHVLKGWAWLAFLLQIPGVLWLARPIYRWIARHRYCLGFDPRVCKM